MQDGALYHCGPVVVKEGGVWKVRAAGPTTSLREEPYMARLVQEHGIRVIIGKGGMGEQTRIACKQHGCVYLHAVGGAAGIIARCVREVKDVLFMNQFGAAEAMWLLEMAELKAVVTIDARGSNLHKRIAQRSRKALKTLMPGATAV